MDELLFEVETLIEIDKTSINFIEEYGIEGESRLSYHKRSLSTLTKVRNQIKCCLIDGDS